MTPPETGTLALHPAPPSPLTFRALAAGGLLAVFLCGVNSYLTLSFGIIEEGPTIAALFFFAFFFLSRKKITSTELVIVATMGSAGGSLGFITNFYAAKAMTGAAYGFWDMTMFAVVTSLIGILFVIPLRELLILREKLPWPGSKATAGIIGVLSEKGDPRQPVFLLVTLVLSTFYVVANTDGGWGLVPDASSLPLFGLAAYGASIAWSPFAIGGAYLMGFRTCLGFLLGGIVLLAMAPHTPDPSAPHRYVWPGIAFLVSSGLTLLVVNWRVMAAAMRSLFSRDGGKDRVDDDPILRPRTLAVLSVAVLAISLAFLCLGLGLSIFLVLMLIVVGAFLQNVIATRAQAQTAFNPARVMGVLLQGITALCGGTSPEVNLTGSGFVAGSGAQAGNLTGDMAYGRWFRVPSRWQFWTQFSTMLPCALVSAWVFTQIRANSDLSIESTDLAAPIAKIWATSALIFDGAQPMPAGAIESMLVAALAGIVWVLFETKGPLSHWLPTSVGIGLGLVLPVGVDFAFFLGGFLLWVVFNRMLKVSDLTLTTIAVGSIVAEGIGGILKPLLQLAGVIPA